MEHLRELLFGADGEGFDRLFGNLTFLLTGPGEWLYRLLFRTPESDQVFIEGQRDLAVPLGILFWLAVLIVLRFAWYAMRQRRPAESTPQLSYRAKLIAGPVGSRVRAAVDEWSWPDVWGAVWRAEVVHIALYAAIPLLWEMGRLMLFVLFLPFTVMSFADQHGWYDETLDHLRRPTCWTFVTFCPGPRSTFLHTPVIDASQCRSAGDCPPGRVLVRDSGGWVWKLAWATLALAWIARWRRRQRSQAR